MRTRALSAAEIQKLAAYRVYHVLDTHRQTDGGISSYTNRCIPTWLKWDMAPAVPQGDVFGWSIFVSGMNICVDMLGIADRVSWTGRWRQRDQYDTAPFVAVGSSVLVERVPTGTRGPREEEPEA